MLLQAFAGGADGHHDGNGLGRIGGEGTGAGSALLEGQSHDAVRRGKSEVLYDTTPPSDMGKGSRWIAPLHASGFMQKTSKQQQQRPQRPTKELTSTESRVQTT